MDEVVKYHTKSSIIIWNKVIMRQVVTSFITCLGLKNAKVDLKLFFKLKLLAHISLDKFQGEDDSVQKSSKFQIFECRIIPFHDKQIEKKMQKAA